MAVLRDKEEEKGQGTSQALGQPVSGQMQPQEPTETQQSQPSGPSTIGGSSATQASAPVTAMPKQQKAGTGTFSNLKTYLQAAQGGGQQKVAQAATQQVQKLGTTAQKGLQQAQESFGRQMQAGSLAGMETAGQEAKDIIGAARAATYQAPQQVPTVRREPGLVQPITEEALQQPSTFQPQTPAQPQQYFTPEQQQRFSEIINAQYQGPASLQQAGLYEQAARKARAAQQAGELTQTAGGREQLLRDVFGRGRDYSRGASRLDTLLLNASEQGVKQLQEQAQPALQSQQALQAAQNLTTNEAAQRKAAIEGIRSQARGAFTGARSEEEQATEKRIDDLIKTPAMDESGNPIQKVDTEGKPVVDAGGNPVYLTEWERLPEFFRQSLAGSTQVNKARQEQELAALNEQYAKQAQTLNELREELKKPRKGISGAIQKAKLQDRIKKLEKSPEYKPYLDKLKEIQGMNLNQWNISPEEAAILGVGSGEGLYNIRPDDIRTAEADRAKLITRDELSRQLALAQLAGTDISNELQKDLLYSDLQKAGTQDLTSSLDVDAFRRLLDESQQTFEDAAEAANLTGIGKKKVSRGNAFGKKTKTYKASVQGNVADMLRQAGYDVDAEGEGVRSLLTDKDLLNRFLGATDTSRLEEANVGGSAIEGTAAGAGTGAAIGGYIGGAPGAGVGAAIGGTVGGMAGANTVDQIQYYSDLAKELEEKLGIKGLGAVGQGVQDIRGAVASPIEGLANIGGSSVVGDIFRGIGGAVGGIDTGAMKAYGSAIAKQKAIQDLQKKYANWLKGQGFENRAAIADTEATRARTAALQELLRRQG